MKTLRWLSLVCLFFLPAEAPSRAAADESAAELFGTMYWTHRDEGVYVAARDGSGVRLLAPAKFADGLAADLQKSTLYWTVSSGEPNRIQKAKFDGSGVQDVLSGLTGTGDLALNAEAAKLYVTLMGEGKIIEIGTNGAERSDLVAGLDAPDELAFDAKHQTLYCTCSGDGSIRQIKLADRRPRTIMTGGTWFGLAVDPTTDLLYCVQASRGTIYRARLDGSEAKPIVNGLTDVDGLAIDPDNQKLYWMQRGKICQANLDGSNVEILVAGKTAEWGSIVVLPPAEQ